MGYVKNETEYAVSSKHLGGSKNFPINYYYLNIILSKTK